MTQESPTKLNQQAESQLSKLIDPATSIGEGTKLHSVFLLCFLLSLLS